MKIKSEICVVSVKCDDLLYDKEKGSMKVTAKEVMECSMGNRGRETEE